MLSHAMLCCSMLWNNVVWHGMTKNNIERHGTARHCCCYLRSFRAAIATVTVSHPGGLPPISSPQNVGYGCVIVGSRRRHSSIGGVADRSCAFLSNVRPQMPPTKTAETGNPHVGPVWRLAGPGPPGVSPQPCTLLRETKLPEFMVALPPQYVRTHAGFIVRQISDRSTGRVDLVTALTPWPRSARRRVTSASTNCDAKQLSSFLCVSHGPSNAAACTAYWPRRAGCDPQRTPEPLSAPSAGGTRCSTFLQRLAHHTASKNVGNTLQKL